MKILIVSQYYWPENSRVTDIAESLKEEGNDVTVLTGLPNYPQGYIYDGYRKGENRIQEHNGVQIIRVKLIERRHDVFHRLLNYYSFPYYGSKMAKKIRNDFDMVLAMEESPIMLVKPAIVYAKKNKKPLIMYEMDLWPESLLAGGVTKKSPIYKHYKKVSAKIYSQFDRIIVSTKEHIPYIRRLPRCDKLNIHYLAQYAEALFEDGDCDSLDDGIVDLMFAGNIGRGQSVDTIIKAAALLNGDERFKFHIVGSGSSFSDIKQLAKSLKADNVVFYGQKGIDKMPEIYKKADVMLVTLEDKDYANMTIPGKVQSYMAAGKPIIGSANGSCANFIINNDIGFVCSPGDYTSLAELIKKLPATNLKEIGQKAKSVYKTKYSKKIFISKLLKHIEDCILEKHL